MKQRSKPVRLPFRTLLVERADTYAGFSTTLTNQSTLDVLWPAATDALSGVDGYRVRLINAATGSTCPLRWSATSLEHFLG